MLKQYKNAFIKMIEAAALNISDFKVREEIWKVSGDLMFIIHYRPFDLTFTTANPLEDPHKFYGFYTIYHPTLKRKKPIEVEFPDGPPVRFYIVKIKFRRWLSEHVRTAIKEELLPDSWAMVSAISTTIKTHRTEKFTKQERRELKLGLATFRVRLIEKFKPNKKQLKVISEQLDYLVAAVDRLNKFDWKGVALSTLIGISTTLTLDTEKGRQLYGLFQQALSTLMHLIR